MAADTDTAFWCDDHVLGSLASSMNIPTFGTVDLLRHLITNGQIDSQLAEAAEAILVRNYHVDLGSNPEVLIFAATLDHWEPAGAAFTLTRPYTWTEPEGAMGFLLTALDHRAEENPDDIRHWVANAAIGLVRIAADIGAASGNLQILMGRLIARSWMRPDRFPSALAGVRQGLVERPGMDDPLLAVLTDSHDNLVKRYGHALAAQLILALVQYSSEQDRRTAVQVIFTSK
jgi:hypothetical protein